MPTPGDPRWLDEQEQRVWKQLAAVLIKIPAELDNQLQRDAQLSYFEYLVMSWLSMAEERTRRMSELADLVNGSLSRLSHVARRLQTQGWLTRRPDPADGRYTLATLTEAGMDKVVGAAPGHVETVRSLVLDPLSKAQIRHLLEISIRMCDAVDEQPTHTR